MKLRALDLFCCAGGATKGLQMAGFHVTGIDVKPQPRYCGDAFIQGDCLALPVDPRGFDFIWASPPCQAFTALRNLQRTQHGLKEYPNLIPQTRALLIASGVTFSIENVEGAPLGDSGNLTMLCGTMFGLQVPDGSAEIRRHRLFETSFSIPLRPACQHSAESLSVTGNGLDSNRDRYVRRRAVSITGSTPQTNTVTNKIRKTYSIHDARAAMGINWMTMKGLSQAIPPAYSEFIGRQAIQHIRRGR